MNRRVRRRSAWPLSDALDRGFIPWDVVALMAAVRPEESDPIFFIKGFYRFFFLFSKGFIVTWALNKKVGV